MKQSTNFPYDVLISSVNLETLPTSPTGYSYKTILPDHFLNDIFFKTHRDNFELIVELNCSSTIYREIFRAYDNDQIQFTVDKNKVAIAFTLDVMVIAKGSIEWGSQFIQKGMPIGHFGSFKIDIDDRSNGLINFLPTKEKSISYSNRDHSIKILIPDKEFNFLLRKQNDRLIKNILASQLAQIALLESCRELKENSTLDNLNWHIELMNRWKVFSGEKERFPEGNDYLPLVSHILKDPSLKLIEHLIYQDKQNSDE